MIPVLSRPLPRGAAILALTAISLIPLARPSTPAGAALPPVLIAGVATDNSSVKIDYQPVAGAKDYRVYDVSNPTTVKYAGITHLDAGVGYHFVLQSDGITPVFPYTSTANWKGGSGPQTLTVPGTEMQWNMLDDGQPHTLVVQAVDALGPVPPANLTDVNDNPLTTPMPGMPMPMLGANEGPTPDGNISINGQGPSTDLPHVIAQSAPFVVQADRSVLALPSRSNALQSFFDTFDSAEGTSLQQVGTTNAASGTMTDTLNAGTSRAWTIIYQGADTDHSYPMVEDGHFMDVLFDGETPSAIPAGWCTKYGLCPHIQYTSMSLSPQPTADLSGGKLLHLTMEVDSHMADTHRWLAWQLAPATDPLTNFRADDYVTSGFLPMANSRAVNHSNQALWLQLFPNNCDAMLFHGSRSATTSAPITTTVIAQMSASLSSYPACHRTVHWGDAGAALDDRDRWDVFLTTTHLALFEDGQLVKQADIPGGLPFSQAKLYFTHYVYSTADQFEGQYLRANAPWETNWLNNFPHSDERHWDNIGFEVLPAADVPADWSTLASLIHMPVSH